MRDAAVYNNDVARGNRNLVAADLDLFKTAVGNKNFNVVVQVHSADGKIFARIAFCDNDCGVGYVICNKFYSHGIISKSQYCSIISQKKSSNANPSNI